MSQARAWQEQIGLTAATALAGCVGGGLLFLITLANALPDCTGPIHDEKWTIFVSGALTAAVLGLLPAVWFRDRARFFGLVIAVGGLYGYLVGYWFGVATDDDPWGPFGYIAMGAIVGSAGVAAGSAITVVYRLYEWCQRRWGRRSEPCGFRRVPARQLPPRVTRTIRGAAWALGMLLAGALLARGGLLPVRLTRAGYWLARNHGQGADLRGANLASASLPDADLYEADLRRANLEGAHLRHASLWCANLSGARLRCADLQGARLLSADLRGASLDAADLAGAVLIGADLTDASLAGASLKGLVFDGRTRWPAGFDAKLRGAVRLGPHARLHSANLRNADLEDEDLHGADLSAANLNGAQLNGANLRGASLRGANFADVRTEWYETVDLAGADLRGADLTGTSLDDETVNLAGAFYDSGTRWPAGFNPHLLDAVDLEGTTVVIRNWRTGKALLRVDAQMLRRPEGTRLFRGARLAGANLSGFDLHETDFSGADLSDANLSGADLKWANLSTANLSGADLGGATYNTHTRWRPGFDPEEHGAVMAR